MIASQPHPIDPPPVAARLLTRDFLFTCAGGLFLFSSFQLLLAMLPLFLKEDLSGGDAAVGWIIGVFAFAALVPRVFIGREIDRGGSRRFLIAGSIIFVAASLSYLLANSVATLLASRGLHGLGMACFHTAAFTFVAQIAPPHRRAEAMGIWGVMSTVATGFAPGAGLLVRDNVSNDAVFLCSAAMALIGVGLISVVRDPVRGPDETIPTPAEAPLPTANDLQPLVELPGTRTRTRSFPRPRRDGTGLLEPSVYLPALLVLLLTWTFGAMQSFVLLFAKDRDISGAGLYFTAYAGALLLARVVGGRVADQRGRWAVIVPTLGLAAAAMVLLVVVTSLPLLLLAGALFGFAFGACQPALTALAIDRVAPARRGAGMATFTSAFELGIGSGSVIMGQLAAATTYGTMFAVSAIFPLIGMCIAFPAASRAARHAAERAERTTPAGGAA